MKGHPFQLGAICSMLFLFNASASVLYVDLNSTNPTLPYADWSTAAANIQNAVDAATNGDLVLVTNGIYATGGRLVSGTGDSTISRLAVTKPVTIQSVNGAAVTVIQGYITNGPGAVRCVYLATNATLIGFTLTNGGTFFWGPNITQGGGILCQFVSPPPLRSSSTVSNCVLVGNVAMQGGGAELGTFNNCVFSNNIAQNGGGASDATFNNCLFTGNSASQGGAIFNFAVPVILNNCTVYGNFATNSGGGCYSFTGFSGTNSIVFGNTATNGSNYHRAASGLTMNYCCTVPLPTNGVGNIASDPLFVNPIFGDFHLQSNSPCINSGNNASVSTTRDFDGNPRIVGGTVDIGAYEFQSPSSILSYAWAQQYGLPTDGSADFIDSDGDGMNNWQEWRAGTVPTNALSLLQMLSLTPTNNPSGLVVTWQSVNTRTYYLQSSINLGAQPAFSAIQSNIVGQVGMTSYTDTSATNGGPYFYRVGVQ
jgi:hypothetical protein